MKSVSWIHEPFRALRVRNLIVTIGVNGIHSVVSIDRFKLARTVEEAWKATKVKRHNGKPWEANDTQDEYVMDCIVCHKNENDETSYLAQWYSNRPVSYT